VASGEHLVTATANGVPLKKQVHVAGGEVLSITLALQDTGGPPPARQEPRDGAGGLPPWTLGIAGAVVLAGGIATTFAALDTVDKRDAFLAENTRPRLDEAYASQTRTNVVLGVTIGVAVLSVAAAVWLVDWKGARRNGRP
jgi:hypothetical protein